jgi:hypothetical protein
MTATVKWVCCHHGMAHPQVVDAGAHLQIWMVAGNILNKQLRTSDNGWSSSFGVWNGAKQIVTKCYVGLTGFIWLRTGTSIGL